MRWIRTIDGETAHIVLPRDPSTLCGITLSLHAKAIVIPGPPGPVRCERCDVEWRRRGRKGRPRRERDLTDYKPIFRIEDWEEL
jgi:hypothetical protein